MGSGFGIVPGASAIAADQIAETDVIADAGVRAITADVSVDATSSIEAVAETWRELENGAIESPGQSLDFTRIWLDSFAIPEDEQLYITCRLGGRPVALLPLHRRRGCGVTVLTWFSGRHVGCNAPLIDSARLAAATPAERRALWAGVKAAARGADLLYLHNLPEGCPGLSALFSDVGTSVAGDTLYRSAFDSFAECDATQRNRSRRKHDKQQGQKLDALGEVAFEEIDSGGEVGDTLDIMFAQRAARFAEQGIANPFAAPDVRRFYARAFSGGGALSGKMHVLRVNGEIVATRYNLIHADRMFCLISSMSIEPRVQPAAPGKQCLLRVMQTVFEQGYSMFDMGAGLTDEKRHWCNVQIPLRHHYVPLRARGAVLATGHRAAQGLRRRFKEHRKAYSLARLVRTFKARFTR